MIPEKANTTQNDLIKIIKGMLALGIGLFGMYVSWNMLSCGNKTPTSSTSTETGRAEIAINVTAYQLWSDYQANEVAADERYKGKELAVSGVVASIDKDFEDAVHIHLSSPNEYMEVDSTLQESETHKAAGISKGDPIVVLCRGKGMVVGSPMLSDCLIQ